MHRARADGWLRPDVKQWRGEACPGGNLAGGGCWACSQTVAYCGCGSSGTARTQHACACREQLLLEVTEPLQTQCRGAGISCAGLHQQLVVRDSMRRRRRD